MKLNKEELTDREKEILYEALELSYNINPCAKAEKYKLMCKFIVDIQSRMRRTA